MGCNSNPSGRPVACKPSDVAGILFRVSRAYFGEALPWSNATNETAAGGGTWRSKVGYIFWRKCGCIESRAKGMLGMSSRATLDGPDVEMLVAASADALPVAKFAGAGA